MKNKKVIIGMIIVLGILVITIGVILTSSYEEEEYADELERAVAVLSKNIPTDIIVYGEKMNFPEGLAIRYISTLEAKELESKQEVSAHCLVINDERNEKTFRKEELKLLYSYIYDKGYIVYYVGTKNIALLDELCKGNYHENEVQDLVVGYYRYGDRIWKLSEFYTVENKKAEEELKKEGEDYADITEPILRELVFLYKEFQSNGVW